MWLLCDYNNNLSYFWKKMHRHTVGFFTILYHKSKSFFFQLNPNFQSENYYEQQRQCYVIIWYNFGSKTSVTSILTLYFCGYSSHKLHFEGIFLRDFLNSHLSRAGWGSRPENPSNAFNGQVYWPKIYKNDVKNNRLSYK